ncbi:hypothetical protein OG948_36470 (plasmid) [Embleya sp. NBC_00888]|uniref:hypothetical protein n=1 Tax=Embleya sp. NBC_00888 TaxID=2975960 RepID=UPI002F907A88|nr:hypothetical protein OG948_36470 [Embleya sp. NBC_00888]
MIERRALLDWALPPEADAEDEESAARVRAGDFTGFHDADGRPVELGGDDR